MPRPAVIAETGSFAVVYKPPLMHSVPLKRAGGPPEADGRLAAQDTLLDWYGELCPPAREVRGRQVWEGGLLHRLDYETDGLVVFAKTQAAFDSLCAQQESGGFAKEYIALATRALSTSASPMPEGRPPSGCLVGGLPAHLRGFPAKPHGGLRAGSCIESAFRPYGPGRKIVRPCLHPFPKDKDIALDHGGYYRTEILAASDLNDKTLVRVRLIRGFRHQIRCHLAWIGCPLAGDAPYGGGIVGATSADNGGFFLRACAVSFRDPDTQEPVRFEIGE
jgi:23S rRNA pseudouridine1911/1915/1917 synthase